jgi:hypothetical protein
MHAARFRAEHARVSEHAPESSTLARPWTVSAGASGGSAGPYNLEMTAVSRRATNPTITARINKSSTHHEPGHPRGGASSSS